MGLKKVHKVGSVGVVVKKGAELDESEWEVDLLKTNYTQLWNSKKIKVTNQNLIESYVHIQN